MTSEQKLRDIWEVANQLEGYVGPDTEARLANFLLREGKEAAKLAERIVELENTRAVPDVPELVRYAPVVGADGRLEKFEQGPYVRYDQAAEMITAKDKEIQELKEKLGVVSTERHADAEYIGHLQAELTQIKEQKPMAWCTSDTRDDDGYFIGYVSSPNKEDIQFVASKHRNGIPRRYPGTVAPLYAAPVDQRAEIEQLRSALARLVRNGQKQGWNDSYEDDMDFARTALSGKEPS